MKRYVLITTIAIVAFLSLGAFGVWIVNPYWMWESPVERAGFNEWKSRVSAITRLAKPWQIVLQEPQSLGMGSSRAEFGINPEHPGWATDDVYNAALVSGSLYELYRMLQHAQATQPLRELVLGVDLFMFAPGSAKTNVIFSENNFRVTADFEKNRRWARLRRWQSLVSISGWSDAWETIQEQDPSEGKGHYLLQNGQRERTHYWYRPAAENGQRWMFVEVLDTFYAEHYPSFQAPTGEEEKWQTFEDILRFCHTHDIEIRLFISPAHAWHAETYRIAGLWDEFEEWKRRLVAVNGALAGEFGIPIPPLWDFGGYNRYTTEEVPPAGTREVQMEWHWEATHYKAELGDIVFDRIFADRHDTDPPADFGVLLTDDTIDHHLAAVREGGAQYRERHPEAIELLEELARSHGIEPPR